VRVEYVRLNWVKTMEGRACLIHERRLRRKELTEIQLALVFLTIIILIMIYFRTT